MRDSRATWNFGTNSEFSLRPTKTTENLDRVGRSQDLRDVYYYPAVLVCTDSFSFECSQTFFIYKARRLNNI